MDVGDILSQQVSFTALRAAYLFHIAAPKQGLAVFGGRDLITPSQLVYIPTRKVTIPGLWVAVILRKKTIQHAYGDEKPVLSCGLFRQLPGDWKHRAALFPLHQSRPQFNLQQWQVGDFSRFCGITQLPVAVCRIRENQAMRTEVQGRIEVHRQSVFVSFEQALGQGFVTSSQALCFALHRLVNDIPRMARRSLAQIKSR